jgi:UDP-2-acetamido-3-amino-2,3-dideoxy-glucuronate N-acetyltransferase
MIRARPADYPSRRDLPGPRGSFGALLLMRGQPSNDAPFRLIRDCSFGEEVVVHSFTNLYGCTIGDGTRLGPFVEIQGDVSIGSHCKIQSHTFICSGVKIGDGVFVSHGVTFVNDKYPRATNPDASLQGANDWELLEVVVESGATIGSGATILGGVRIGAGAMVGAGAVVTHDVVPGATVAGNPARMVGPQGADGSTQPPA